MKTNPHLKRLEELVVFALFGAMMFLSAQIDIIPNVHPLALFIVSLTIVYRVKALIPIYLYVMLEGIVVGFNLWWVPYLYIWTILWAMAMLIPKGISQITAGIIAAVISTLHGIGFGLLYLPFELFTLHNGDIRAALTWTAAGITFDVLHMIGNFASSLLCVPIARLICLLAQKKYPFKPVTKKH